MDIVKRLLAKKADPNAKLKAAIMQRQHTQGDSTLGAGSATLGSESNSNSSDMNASSPVAQADRG